MPDSVADSGFLVPEKPASDRDAWLITEICATLERRRVRFVIQKLFLSNLFGFPWISRGGFDVWPFEDLVYVRWEQNTSIHINNPLKRCQALRLSSALKQV